MKSLLLGLCLFGTGTAFALTYDSGGSATSSSDSVTFSSLTVTNLTTTGKLTAGGTSSPNAGQIEANATTGNLAAISAVSGSQFARLFSTDASAPGIAWLSGVRFRIGDGTLNGGAFSERISIDGSNGNLGLNDTTPDGQLDVVSNQAPTGYVLSISSQNDTTGNLVSVLGSGNVGIGVPNPSTKLQLSSGVFSLDGTTPYVTFTNVTSTPSAVSTQGSIWANTTAGSAEVKVEDGAGNVTQISPHNAAGEWVFYSENVRTGKRVFVNMEKFIHRMEKLTGERFIYDSQN